jgi:hypothetical protein
VPIVSVIKGKYLMLGLVTTLATSMIITPYPIIAQPLSSPLGAAPDINVGVWPVAIAVNPNT